MARTRDTAAHALKRDAFLDVAQRIITTRGYDQLSIQEVLDELGASKGAFYHYFDSKQALFVATIDRMIDGAVALIEPVVSDPALSAPQKFHDMFAQISGFKNQQRELIIALLNVWLADENAAMRDRFRSGMAVYLTPNFERIIHQGLAEGCFQVDDPAASAMVLTTLIQGVNDVATSLFIQRQLDRVTAHRAFDIFETYMDAANRVLGAAPGTVVFSDRALLDQWFA